MLPPCFVSARTMASVLRIVLDPAVASVSDSATGDTSVELAVVAVGPRPASPSLAGWAALAQPRVAWPFESLDQADREVDPEPRRCLLRHLVRQALERRPWWDRVLRPAVTLVLPFPLSRRATEAICFDARIVGAARRVQVEVR